MAKYELFFRFFQPVVNGILDCVGVGWPIHKVDLVDDHLFDFPISHVSGKYFREVERLPVAPLLQLI